MAEFEIQKAIEEVESIASSHSTCNKSTCSLCSGGGSCTDSSCSQCLTCTKTDCSQCTGRSSSSASSSSRSSSSASSSSRSSSSASKSSSSSKSYRSRKSKNDKSEQEEINETDVFGYISDEELGGAGYRSIPFEYEELKQEQQNFENLDAQELKYLPLTYISSPAEEWEYIRQACASTFTHVKNLKRVSNKTIKLIANMAQLALDQKTTLNQTLNVLFIEYAAQRSV